MTTRAWEHKSVLAKGAGVFSGKLKTDDIEAVLQREGADGWELVTAMQASNVSAKLPGILLLFKRPA